jgi:hypothetical protein
MMVVSAFGDEYVKAETTIVLEDFNQSDNAQYDWKVEGSRFTTKTDKITYPQAKYVETWPSQLFNSKDGTDGNGNQLKAFGINGAFDRRGPNWIDIYPVALGAGEDATPLEMPLPGRAESLSMWVWGMNLNYNLEVYVRDYRGIIHSFYMGGNRGSLDFQGWKSLTAEIPSSVVQSKKVLPHLASLTLVKFRLNTDPKEQVTPFFVYFDQLTVKTDTYESIYDGNELASPEKASEIWNEGEDQ